MDRTVEERIEEQTKREAIEEMFNNLVESYNSIEDREDGLGVFQRESMKLTAENTIESLTKFLEYLKNENEKS